MTVVLVPSRTERQKRGQGVLSKMLVAVSRVEKARVTTDPETDMEQVTGTSSSNSQVPTPDAPAALNRIRGKVELLKTRARLEPVQGSHSCRFRADVSRRYSRPHQLQ